MKGTFKIGYHSILTLVIICSFSISGYGQEEYKDQKNKNLKELYPGGSFYEVEHFAGSKSNKKTKNIILMIGDGMGLVQVFASMTANGGHLFLENFLNIGFSKTSS